MIVLKRNNTAIGLSFKLMDIDNKPIILNNCDVFFKLANENNQLLINKPAQIKDKNNGLIHFFFNSNEINISGKMEAEIELVYSNGDVETFPKSGTIPILIVSDL